MNLECVRNARKGENCKILSNFQHSWDKKKKGNKKRIKGRSGRRGRRTRITRRRNRRRGSRLTNCRAKETSIFHQQTLMYLSYKILHISLALLYRVLNKGMQHTYIRVCMYADGNESVLHITQVSTYSFNLLLLFLLLSLLLPIYFATYYRVFFILYTFYRVH